MRRTRGQPNGSRRHTEGLVGPAGVRFAAGAAAEPSASEVLPLRFIRCSVGPAARSIPTDFDSACCCHDGKRTDASDALRRYKRLKILCRPRRKVVPHAHEIRYGFGLEFHLRLGQFTPIRPSAPRASPQVSTVAMPEFVREGSELGRGVMVIDSDAPVDLPHRSPFLRAAVSSSIRSNPSSSISI